MCDLIPVEEDGTFTIPFSFPPEMVGALLVGRSSAAMMAPRGSCRSTLGSPSRWRPLPIRSP